MILPEFIIAITNTVLSFIEPISPTSILYILLLKRTCFYYFRLFVCLCYFVLESGEMFKSQKMSSKSDYSELSYTFLENWSLMMLSKNTLTSLCIILNITSSISIVMLNKWIYTHYKFPNITLTFIHFIMTYCGLKVCEFFNIFCPKRLQLKDLIPLAVSFCGFVVLTNLSLQYNTVGTYQLIKVLTTPCIMGIHTQFYGKKYTLSYYLTLVRCS